MSDLAKLAQELRAVPLSTYSCLERTATVLESLAAAEQSEGVTVEAVNRVLRDMHKDPQDIDGQDLTDACNAALAGITAQARMKELTQEVADWKVADNITMTAFGKLEATCKLLNDLRDGAIHQRDASESALANARACSLA